MTAGRRLASALLCAADRVDVGAFIPGAAAHPSLIGDYTRLTGRKPAIGNPPSKRLYPGDRYVDWVGLSGFSWGGPWDWKSAISMFRGSYEELLRIPTKPVALAETGAGDLVGAALRSRGWGSVPGVPPPTSTQ